jgi:hypothetical protein
MPPPPRDNRFRRVAAGGGGEPQVTKIDDDVSLDDSEICEPAEPDSPEGQLILVEAVRSLERRLTPEARAAISDGEDTFTRSTLKRFYCQLRSFFHPKDLDLSGNPNSAAKQSVED